MRLAVASAIATAAMLATTAEDAQACSCAPPDARTLLATTDAAFVGRLESRRETGNGRVVLTFRVERSVKGRLGSSVDVETASSGSTCGVETSMGERIGLFLDRSGSRWSSTLCWQVAPDDLLAAAPVGGARPAMFVGGRFGSARLLGLDTTGRTVARGTGRGTTTHVSVCPGRQRLAEIVSLDRGYRVAIRDTASLRLIREQTFRLPGRRRPAELLCENSAGSSVVVFARWWCCDAPYDSAIYRLGRRLTTVWNGAAYTGTLTRDAAFLCGPNERGDDVVQILSLKTRRPTRRVVISGPCARFVPNPTSTHLAGGAYGIAGPTYVTLIALGRTPPIVQRLRLSSDVEVAGDVYWRTQRDLIFLPYVGGPARVLDLSLRTRARFGWIAGSATLVGSTVFGIHRDRTLRRASLPAGPMVVLRRLPGTPEVIVAGG